MTLSIHGIVAASKPNRVIGYHNQLPWNLPNDLKHFKNITNGQAILMGRKTYESIGRPLPNRLNLILTRQSNFEAPQCTLVHSLEDAIQQTKANGREILFIIGGSQLFESYLDQIDTLHLTEVEADIPGDTFMPTLDMTEWKEVSRESHSPDATHAYAYTFIELKRMNKP